MTNQMMRLNEEKETMPSSPTTDVIKHVPAVDAAAIPPVSPDEAAALASVELERLLTLLESFSAADWESPTFCTLWNVQQVVSHVAGALAAYADWDLLLERSLPWTQGKADQHGMTMPVFLADLAGMPQQSRDEYAAAGFIPLDALNQFEVDQRAEATPDDLISELRVTGPAAIANRRGLPDEVRGILLPVVGAKAPVSYLVDVIYPRDIWMHRIELMLSIGRAVPRTAEQDGRLTALVMRDLARRLNPILAARCVLYHLTGPDGGVFRFGTGDEPEAAITLDTVEFHLLASGRRSVAEALGAAAITGDAELATLVLQNTVVVY